MHHDTGDSDAYRSSTNCAATGPATATAGASAPAAGAGRRHRGDIRTALLAILAEGPGHGYDLISRLEDKSGGAWRPSAGSVYPTLQQLEDEGLATSAETDGKRVYTITAAGAEEATRRVAEAGAEPWAVGSEGGVHPGHLFRSIGALGLAARQVVHAGTPDQLAKVVDDRRQRPSRRLPPARRRADRHRLTRPRNRWVLVGPFRRRTPIGRCSRQAVACSDNDPLLRHDADLLRQRRAAHRARLHDDRRRRRDPLAPPARRAGQVPHRHRRARPQDPAGRRRRRAVPAGVRRRHRPALRRCLGVAGDRQRRLHPHHRAAPPHRRPGAAATLLRRRRHRARPLPRQVLRALRGVLHRRRAAPRRPVPDPQAAGRRVRGGELLLPPVALRRPPARLVRRPPRRHRPRVPRQRGARADPLRAARLLDQPHERRLGHPPAVGLQARRLRLVRRPHQLPQRRRLRP